MLLYWNESCFWVLWLTKRFNWKPNRDHSLVAMVSFKSFVLSFVFSFYNFEENISLSSMFDEEVSLAGCVSISRTWFWWDPDLVVDSEMCERREDEFESRVPNPPDLRCLLGLLMLPEPEPSLCRCSIRHTWPREMLVASLSRRSGPLWASVLSIMSSTSFFLPGSTSIMGSR